MGRDITKILSELGRRLERFDGGGDDTRRAAANLSRDMLSPLGLAAWFALYPALPVSAPRNVLVIMAGNIPFVGMHDLVCTLAAGHRAMVKPSSKDFANMSWVVEQLLDIAPCLPVMLASDASPAPDAVIAMGSDAAVATIREKYGAVPMLLRGNRSSLAIIDGNETPDELAGVADDVLSYSGLGCRNVSLVFVPRGYDFSALQNALFRQKNTPGEKYRNNYRQTRAMLRLGAVPHIDCGACLLVENRDFPGQPSILNYTFYDTLSEVADWVAGHDTEIQCVATRLPFAHPRTVPSGMTQRPSLTDYPDGRDTMQFLAAI